MSDKLWSEEYRPATIADCILPEHLKKSFQEIVNSKSIPNMLLSGTSGLGKTTVARALCNELNADYILINGSEDSGIDVLRSKIRQFASTRSLMDSGSNQKVVILDEADYLNCLDSEEQVQLSDGTLMALKDMEPGVQYSVLSMTEDGAFVNDTAEVVNQLDKMVYEIALANGKTIRCTDDHPIMCKTAEGNIVERTIKTGFDDVEIILK